MPMPMPFFPKVHWASEFLNVRLLRELRVALLLLLLGAVLTSTWCHYDALDPGNGMSGCRVFRCKAAVGSF